MAVKTPSEVYADLRSETIDLVRDLDAATVATRVPQCPDWSVKEVIAHVTGIAEDMVSDNLDGIGSDMWTAAQVERHSAMSLAQVCEAWAQLGPAIDELTATSPFMGVRITADLVTHVHDMAGAIGVAVERDTDAVRMGLDRYGPFFCERAAAAGLPVVRVEALDQQWQSEEGRPAAVLRGSSFELLRAFSGRRSQAQVRAMDWEGDSEPYLSVITPYGLPELDFLE